MTEQPLILVVDDDPTIPELVKEVLGGVGCQVDTAAGGAEALACLQARAYDLVLTDMVMPEMGGLELLQHLRLHQPDTLVIIFTGYASYQDAVAAVKLGAFDYLSKPLEPEILKHAVTRALEYQRLTRATRDLEAVFQGAEALGVQALELLRGSREAEVLAALKEQDWQGQELQEVGARFLKAARALTGATHSSIFLFDAAAGQFSGLAALGPQAEARAAAVVPAFEGLLGHVATSRRPLLVPDLGQDARFPFLPRRDRYHTDSFLIVPLSGVKFWGVLSLTDKAGGQPMAPRDLFLAWLLGRVLVATLESREGPEAWPAPAPAPAAASEVERLKQRLQLFEHLAIAGKLTLCAAHELNNPLDGIRRYLSLAQLKKHDPGEVERYLSEAQKGLQRMSMTLKSLMFSVNPWKGPAKAADSLVNLLKDAVKIMMFQASDQRVEVALDVPFLGQELRVEADLYHVFINVIKNALQAMPQGGALKITGRGGAKEVGITFADTGPGLDSGELEKIFQPFYSTKEGLEGLGLGLPICQKILARYGGRLEVKSTPGRGTRVTVVLPRGRKES